MSETHASADELTFSLVRHDPWFRLQRVVGLIPASRLGIVRRCLVFALVTWLPIAIWALYWRRAFPGEIAEPLLQHFGVHVRCLLAIPLLVIAEIAGELIPQSFVRYFVTSGLVTDDTRTLIGVNRFCSMSISTAIRASASAPAIRPAGPASSAASFSSLERLMRKS